MKLQDIFETKSRNLTEAEFIQLVATQLRGFFASVLQEAVVADLPYRPDLVVRTRDKQTFLVETKLSKGSFILGFGDVSHLVALKRTLATTPNHPDLMLLTSQEVVPTLRQALELERIPVARVSAEPRETKANLQRTMRACGFAATDLN